MELAQKAGLDLNQPLMSAMESGKVLPTPNDLQSVCEALQCTPIDLFDSVEEFDLMAVQKRMKRKEITDDQLDRFSFLPPANPEHKFRMCETDYIYVKSVLKSYGYNSIGQYLRDTVLNGCPQRKRA